MLMRKGILWFVIRLLIIYGLLATPWPGLQEAYAKAFRSAASYVFGRYGSRGIVRFLPLEPPKRTADTEITTHLEGSRLAGVTEHSTRLAEYLPTAAVVALILATSIPWSRRFKALLWGLVLVHVFIAVRLQIALVHWFSADQPWGLHDPSPSMKQLVDGLHEIVNVSPTLSFLAPVFIWVLVTLRRSDLEALADAGGEASAESA